MRGLPVGLAQDAHQSRTAFATLDKEKIPRPNLYTARVAIGNLFFIRIARYRFNVSTSATCCKCYLLSHASSTCSTLVEAWLVLEEKRCSQTALHLGKLKARKRFNQSCRLRPCCYFPTGVGRVWSSARLSSSTLTRGSPSTPNWRPVVCSAISFLTISSPSPRALATIGA